MDNEGKQAVMDAPMPITPKGMQRLLGTSDFFQEFISDYSGQTSKLNDVIKPTFNWDWTAWKTGYDEDNNKVKIALADRTAKYFADYGLNWILGTDASEVVVAAFQNTQLYVFVNAIIKQQQRMLYSIICIHLVFPRDHKWPGSIFSEWYNRPAQRLVWTSTQNVWLMLSV